jgi:hypothetical protein
MGCAWCSTCFGSSSRSKFTCRIRPSPSGSHRRLGPDATGREARRLVTPSPHPSAGQAPSRRGSFCISMARDVTGAVTPGAIVVGYVKRTMIGILLIGGPMLRFLTILVLYQDNSSVPAVAPGRRACEVRVFNDSRSFRSTNQRDCTQSFLTCVIGNAILKTCWLKSVCDRWMFGCALSGARNIWRAEDTFYAT